MGRGGQQGRGWNKWRKQHGNIYIAICKIDGQWEFAVYNRELNPVLCNNLEEWGGVGDGRDVQEGRYLCFKDKL